MESSLNTRLGNGCQICFLNYNAKDKRPRCLPCGHSFCSSCISKSIQGMRILCPNCRQEHKAKTMSTFPVNYELESVVQENPNSSHSMVEKTSGNTSVGISKKLRSMKEDMDSNIKDIGFRGLETRSQLYQYKSNLGKWKRQHEENLQKHKVIVHQHDDVIQRINKEMDKVDEAIAAGDKEEQTLKAAENSLTMANTANDIFPALAEVDFHCASFEKWRMKMHQCFPDTKLVIQSQELKERSKEGLLKLLEPLEKNGEAAVLTEGPSSDVTPTTTKVQHQNSLTTAAAGASASASGAAAVSSCEDQGEDDDDDAAQYPSIEEKVKRALDSVPVRLMNQTVDKIHQAVQTHQVIQTDAAKTLLEVQDLVNMTPYAKQLLESGRVYAVKKEMGKLRYARITLDKNRSLCLHALRKLDRVSEDIISLQYDDVIRLFYNETRVDGVSSSPSPSSSSTSRFSFMELGDKRRRRRNDDNDESVGRMVFNLYNYDTPFTRQFVLHCTAEKGSSLFDCKVSKYPYLYIFLSECKSIKELTSDDGQQLVNVNWVEEWRKDVYKKENPRKGELWAFVYDVGDSIQYGICNRDFERFHIYSVVVIGKVDDEGLNIVSSLYDNYNDYEHFFVLDSGIGLRL